VRAAGSDRCLAGDAKSYFISVTSYITMLELLGTRRKIRVNNWITVLVSERGQKAREVPLENGGGRDVGAFTGGSHAGVSKNGLLTSGSEGYWFYSYRTGEMATWRSW
jgi:hypothetical protein